MTLPEQAVKEPEGRALLRSERSSANNWLRAGRALGHAALSRVVGGAAATERMLDRALSPGGPVPAAFAVPLPYALRGLGDGLCIELPTALLERRLADWVRYGRETFYVGDYFLGLQDWERISFAFARTGVMREAQELASLDLQYRESRSYRYYRQRIAEGRPVRRNKVVLSSDALLDAYFERYVGLFRSIRAHGVVPLRRAREVASDLSAASRVRRYRTEAGERDIGVAIGPGGQILGLPGGKHRAAIATVSGIAAVPVEVRMVHAEWVLAMRRRHGCGWVEAVRRGVGDVESAYALRAGLPPG